MRKILLGAFALCAAMAVNAQTETGYASSDVTDNLTAYLPAGTVLNDGTYITWSIGVGDTYKKGGASATVAINSDNVKFAGVTGSTNPSTIGEDGTTITSCNGKTTEIPDTGTVYNLAAHSDGYLYVLGKVSTSKPCIVWKDGKRIPYVWVADDSANQAVISFDLSDKADLDEDGAVSDSYEILQPDEYVGFDKGYSEDCQASVIKFAVEADHTYSVCLTGSKFAMGAYYYDQTGNATITYDETDDDGNVTHSYTLLSEGETTGINSAAVVATKIADNAIYNLAGQRVSKASKGVFVVNGKKILVK